jgi:hypothetical protein
MTDVLKGLTGNATVFLFAWIFPSALVLGVIGFFLMPWLVWVPHDWQLSTMDLGKATLIVAFAAVGLGLLMSGIETQLYRVLEWYAFPRQVHQYGLWRQRHRRGRLQNRLMEIKAEAAKRQREGKPYPGWEETLVEEKLARFPTDESELAASRLANALRAFETYGANRYHLDSTTLWTELLVVVPEALRKELDQSRAAVDFLISLVYLTVAFGVITLSGLVGRGKLEWKLLVDNWGFVAVAVAAFLLARFWYKAAVVVCSYWASTVRALVNIGRGPLANQLGVSIPVTIHGEREMWEAVSSFVINPKNDANDQALDRFRVSPATGAGPPRAAPANRPAST